MSTFNFPLLDSQVHYIDLPEYYPQLSLAGGDNYQPAAYTEGNDTRISYAILLPIDADEVVVLPDNIEYNDDNGGKLACLLTIITDNNSTPERLAMIKFSIEPTSGAGDHPIEIMVSDGNNSKGGGLKDRHLGKVVMDSNILPA